eukprot:5599488-Amphidinium_carterae.1
MLIWSSEALAKYERFMGALDAAVDTELTKDASDVLMQSYTTKCSAVCMWALTQDMPKEKIRAHVQAEVQGLKSKGLHESKALHPVLLERVMLALFLRLP